MADTLRVVIAIPGLRVKTIGNTRVHWRVEAKEAREQRALTIMHCRMIGNNVRDQLRAAKSLKVKFVRIGGRKLDKTNCVGAFKHVQDSLCEWIGVDDSSDWYDWQWPTQESGDGYSVRIELEAVN